MKKDSVRYDTFGLHMLGKRLTGTVESYILVKKTIINQLSSVLRLENTRHLAQSRTQPANRWWVSRKKLAVPLIYQARRTDLAALEVE